MYMDLSPSAEPSPSLEADEPRDSPPGGGLSSPGTTSSLRCTVNELLPFLPKPNLRFRPNRTIISKIINR